MRVGLLALGLLLIARTPLSAEWQIKPFLGVTFGGRTTFVDLERSAGSANAVFGAHGVLLGEVLGVEGDFGHAPGFFQSGDRRLVLGSSVTTLTGNIIVALPRHWTEYTLRPYFVGGWGLMHVRVNDLLGVLRVADTLPALDVGGGVTGFLTDRIGLGWDLRHFQSIGREPEGRGLSFGGGKLSFWRANMSLAIRY